MSKTSERLTQIVSLAKSKKVTDYKKAIKLLLEFWEDITDNASFEISSHQSQDSSNMYDTYSCSDIYIIVHELFIKEIVRIKNLSGNSGNLDKERVIKLLYLTLSRTIDSLRPKYIINSILQILQIENAEYYSEFYEVYMSNLRKHVLQRRSKRIQINCNHWQELLSACIPILKKVIPKVEYAKLLETLELIVRHGCSSSTLLFETRKLLPIIGNILENYESYDIKSTEVLFKLTFTVCQQIATDSRFILCRFAENMPLSLIDQKGPEEKYKLYLLLIHAHHPNGAILDDDVSYCYNNDKWKAILNLLYKMILNDIKPTNLLKSFVELACEVFRQRILTNLASLSQSNSLHDSLYIQPRKKRRTSDNQEKVVDLVNDSDPDKAWPMIQIATTLYRKYPNCLKINEYVEFLDVVIKLMSQAFKNFYIMENLCDLATVFVNNEKIYERNDLRNYWDKIWDAVLRFLSMSHKELVRKGFILIQNLISHKKVSNPTSILKLYLTKSIQWSNFSIQTLKIFCENNILPNELVGHDMNLMMMTNNSLKLQLLRWILDALNKRLPTSLSIAELSKILIGFTLKSWYKLHEHVILDGDKNYLEELRPNFYDYMNAVTVEDVEQCYLSLQFNSNLPINQNDSVKLKLFNDKCTYIPYVIENLDFLINSLIQLVQTEEADEDLSLFITKAALIAQVTSDLKAMKMIECSFDEFCLVKELKTCLEIIFSKINKIDWSKSIRFTVDVTKSLILLYQIQTDVLINDIILMSTSLQSLKQIYEVCKLKRCESELDLKIAQCKLNALIVLSLFCCLNVGREISEEQIKIVSTILKLKKYDLNVESDVVCVLTILDIFTEISDNMLTEEFVELLMDFVRDVFEEWQNDDKVNRILLQLLPKVFNKVRQIHDTTNVDCILYICKIYHDQFAKGAFGQLTHLSLVRCLNRIVRHDAFNNSKVLDHDAFITFIISPYYLVRLESLNYIYSIFSLNKIDYIWKAEFFKKLEEAAQNIFLVQRELAPGEAQEEQLLRSTSAMQMLATVICSKSTFQSPALYTLLKIVVDKSIDLNIIKKTLNVIDKSTQSSTGILKENLNYLLTSWCQVGSLDSFPRILLNCSSDADFYDSYIHYIFPVLIREGKSREARNLCDNLGVSFEQVFKECCSSIIPWALSDEQLHMNEEGFQGIDDISSLIRESLQQIIIGIVLRLHDLTHFYRTFEITVSLPASDPPHFKCEVVDRCFEQLIMIVNNDSHHSVFYFVITRKPSTIQRILLQLARNVYAGRISEYRAKAFHQYVYFCSRIVEELTQKHCDHVATYFVKDIGCTLLHLVRDEDAFIASLALKYLQTFLMKMLPTRSAQVENILDLCVKTLAPLVKSVSERSTAKEVLDFLIKEQRQCLADAIENLGSLPSVLKSEEDTESQILRENLQHFLKVSDDKSCSIEGLLSLKRQLVSKMSQLEKLYEELESIQGFAEHCATSVLHRLVYRLIRLTESKDEQIALEAAKCLGILGPADLTTMILHPQETQRRESLDKADMLTRKICRMLSELVVSEDIELRTVSSNVLYDVLESPWGTRLDLNDSNEDEKNWEHFVDFTYPFRSGQKSKTPSRTNVHIEMDELNDVFDQENLLWTEESNGSYNTWIANITSAVANCLSFYSKSLSPVFKLNVQFCEVTLPRLISLIVDTNSNLAKKVCHCVNRFFDYHFSYDGDQDQTLCAAPQRQQTLARDAIRCMLNVVNHLRIQTKEQIHLDFNYLTIAMAAQLCSAYFSSVLYAELWCRANLEVPRDFDSIPIIDQIYEQESRKGKIVQDILKEAYMKIGDSDSLYGSGSSHLQNRRSRIPYYTNFQKLDKLILSHDVGLSVENYSIRGMVNALRESSLHYLAKRLLGAMPMQVDSTEDLCYDSLWRLSDWSQITSWKTLQSSEKINEFSTFHYATLKSLNDNDNSSVENYLKEAYLCIVKDLCNISLESCEAVYPKLSQLQMLREIEEFSSTRPEDYIALLNNWERQKYIFNNNFQYIEPILSQRAVMFNIRESVKNNPSIKSASINIQLEISRLAQQQGHFNAAARALETLSKQTDFDEETEDRLVYHEAKLAWMRKDEDMARFNLRSLIKKDSVKPSLLARALRVYGNWIAENKSENPQVIIAKYYNKAISTYTSMDELSIDDLKDGCRARAALAQFAHEQYLTITEYLMSPQFESLKECIDHTLNAVPKSKVTDRDVARAVRDSKQQSNNDNAELKNIEKDKDLYLSIAVMNYLLTLQDSDNHDFLIFRLISLWLDNIYDSEVNKILEKYLSKVPSYKFIPLVPQLAPHMNYLIDEFTRKINQILERCAMEHPHHTLPILLALKNLYNDSKYCGKKVTKQEPRVLGAQTLIQKLLSTEIRPIIQEMDKLSDALVMLAYYDLEKKKATVSKCPIPRTIGLNDIKNFQHSVVPTMAIDVKKNGNYTNIISVRKYESTYSNVGGINAPKKITCIGSDGIERPQLVKGRDDLRQDAVMQQVFTVMNSLLKSNKDSKQRRLHIRTYKVVPLTQRSGILQWCENTLPIGIILTGEGSRNPGLHRKYYPNDFNPNDCRRRMQSLKANEQKYNVFMDICKNLRPAFHHFFTESYLSPETWFERRLAYTRSVATTSIIGYILGLGDRHVSNILIDQLTAEVIHIDFGIAFEQGKVLPTPETVPFRLTRDIEVAMGVSGVEGTMRRCCEETMTVLRNQKEIIVTLLRVLLYDPLYSWAITPAQAATYQSEHSSRSSENQSDSPVGIIETNKLAERALLRVQQKLQGIEEGVASSIEGQVERLIQQARDPRNLSQLFNGWQAYL